MVTIGGLLASAAVKIAGDKLGSIIAEQASLVWNVRNHLEDMKITLETMEAALQDAEKRSIKEKEVRLWLKRLKNAAYDISDMLDEFQEMSTRATRQMTGILPISIRKIFQAHKMKSMREKLKKIEAEHTSFKFVQSTITIIDQPPYNPRETTSDVIESDIIGRDAEKKHIIQLLSADENRGDITIVPIYGLGGIGKSTLAAQVYNDTQFMKYDHRVWVYVSEVFDLKKIGRSLILQLQTCGQQNTDTLQLINRSLDDLLRGKKVLIVLDDIWEEDDMELDKLKTVLHKKSSMIDVIVTTRNEETASKICTCNKPYKLQPLKDDFCWDIIKRSSQFESKPNKGKLEQIGLDIAKKCGGVALAAQALGYLLKSKDLRGWSEVNDSDIWRRSFEDDNLPYNKVLPSLKLSFEKMPPKLRLCFSYCAVFPKGHDIVEDDLIHQWVALDFIKASEGKGYTKQLLGMSFLQRPKLSSEISEEHVVRYTMHDLVHDLARSVIGDELVVIDAVNKNNTRHKFCRYALLTNYDGQTKLSYMLPQKIRALHFSDSSKLGRRDGSFSFAKCLRILDFSECSSILLPASICQLKQLRCLIAPRIENEMLPDCISKLSKLQCLNLQGSSHISTLPESIGKLGGLIYLGLSGCSGITKLPRSFGDLKCIVHLDISGCSGITELPGSLGNLTNLQHLVLSKCSGAKVIPDTLCGLTNLQYLNLSYCHQLGRLPESIGSLINLQYLSISHCYQIRELPESFEKLQNLLHLDVKRCRNLEGLPQALHTLTALQHLNISYLHSYYSPTWDGDLSYALGNLTNLKYLSLGKNWKWLNAKHYRCLDFVGTLTHLEHLDLSCNTLDYLPECLGKLKRLHTLDLTSCVGIKSLPGSVRANRLKFLLMGGCSRELIDQANYLLHYSQILPLFHVRAGDASGRSNLHLLEDVNVGELNIRSLENVRTLEEGREVKFLEKNNLSKLTLAWTLGADRLLEEKDLLGQLEPPRSLENFELEGYSSTCFPSWLMSISQHLPNIVYIRLAYLPNCTSLPPLGQLPNLQQLSLLELRNVTKMDKDFCGGIEAFRRLSSFTMEGMHRLEEWNTTYSGEDGVEVYMFPALDRLQIMECPRLRLKPCPPTFCECILYRSDQIISSLGEVNNISHLSTRSTKLLVQYSECQNMKMFCHFPALQELDLLFCSNLTSFPESIRLLSSLQSLTLQSCNNISALPEWLGELSSLRSLTIMRCSILKSLPPCIQELTNLHKLRILWNSELKKWCTSEENKMKLVHIKQTMFKYCD